MATDIGKVGIVLKGTWSNSATYEVLDAVNYNGGTYIAKSAVPAGTLPTNTTYWQEGLTQRGTVLSQARGATPTWDLPLVAGMVIIYGRAASSKKGLGIIDQTGTVMEVVPFDGISVSVANSTVSISCTTAGQVTVIVP